MSGYGQIGVCGGQVDHKIYLIFIVRQSEADIAVQFKERLEVGIVEHFIAISSNNFLPQSVHDGFLLNGSVSVQLEGIDESLEIGLEISALVVGVSPIEIAGISVQHHCVGKMEAYALQTDFVREVALQ